MAWPEKYVEGTFLHSSGDPIQNATVTFTLSDELVDTTDNEIGDDDSFTTTTNDFGYFIVQLHINNDPLDHPVNSHWSVAEPTGTTRLIFVDKDNPLGDDSNNAIPYASIIVALPDDLPPNVPNDVQDQLDDITAWLTALSNADNTTLASLSKPTTLVDDALAGSTAASSSTPGTMSVAHYNLVASLASGQTYDLTTMARKDATGIVLPSNVRPTSTLATGTGRMYVNTTSGEAEVVVPTGSPAANSPSVIAPGFDSPAALISSAVTITSTTPQTIVTIDVKANSTYEVRALVWYVAPGSIGLLVRFASIPTSAVLLWDALGLDSATIPGTGGTGQVNTTRHTQNQNHIFAGQGTTDTSTMTRSGLIKGLLVTAGTAGTMQFQAAHGAAGATTNPQVLSGTALFFDRRL